MKKAFTLIEVLVSITLFSILLLFLYQSLELTQSSNKFYEDKLNTVIETNRLKKVFLEDIAQATQVETLLDENQNSILSIKTTNMYHNPFYKYVTYLLTDENNLLRSESLTKFNKTSLNETFFANTYLDILLPNMETFKVNASKENKDIFAILYKQEKNSRIYFNTLKIKTTTSSK